MELLQLRYFQRLAKSGHLTQTANELHISPPSLSNTIKRLEKELGVSLFDRSDKKKMRLTEQGEIFEHYISNALSSINQGIRALKLEENSLQIAMTNFMIWAEAIYYCESCQPDLSIDYSLISMEDINTNENTAWNLFLGASQDVDADLYNSEILLPPERPVVILSNKHPLAERSSIRLEELKEDVFITTKMVNSAAYHYMLRLCKISGFQPKKMLNVDYLMRSKLLEKNSGIAIATELGWKLATIQSENIIAIPLSSPILPRTQAVSWRKSHILSKSECDFIRHLKEFIHTHLDTFVS